MKRYIAVFLFLFVTSASFASSWSYSKEVDEMADKLITYARLGSDNSLNLPFPYSGTNHGELMVRKHPKYGISVIVSIDKGQLLCPSYTGCSVQVRFGDAPPVSFQASPPADGRSDHVFLQGQQRFIAQAKKVRKIMVQMNIYQAGAPVLEFNSPDPLVWGTKAITIK
ncbi:MAG: hypothetical protein IPH35_03365 [Rhodoferax sp.]|nr:hypothetical protein [Rhodoferax sp.]